jgi:hypothetical protein
MENGTTTISGESTNGTGVGVNGSVTTADNGETTINGSSTDGTGVTVDPNGSVSTTDSGTTTISSESINGTGADLKGTISTSDNGVTTINGISANGVGMNVDPNSAIRNSGNGVTQINDNGEITILRAKGTSSSDNNGQNNGQAATHGSGGGTGAAIAAVGAGGLAAFIWADAASHWYLAAPQELTLEIGDAVYWADATVDSVSVDTLLHTASVELSTHAGTMSRALAYRDGADGVKHFVYEDEQTQTKADLSVNVQTHEYFYTERGTKDGKAYVVKAHGWLKPGIGNVTRAATVKAGV